MLGTPTGVALRWCNAWETMATLQKDGSSNFSASHVASLKKCDDQFLMMQGLAWTGLVKEACIKYKMQEFDRQWGDFIQKVQNTKSKASIL